MNRIKKNKNSWGSNPFSCYMSDYSKGAGKGKSGSEIAEEAGKLWERMTAAEKQPYLYQANRNKGGKMGLTSFNEDIEMLKGQEETEKMNAEQINTYIENYVKVLYENKTISTEYFYLIHFNDFYAAVNKGSYTLKHYPAEVALIRFNLLDGVLEKNIFHKLLNPGSFPSGAAFSVKTACEQIHRIPKPKTEDCNLGVAVDGIKSFLKEFGDDTPPMYARPNDMKLCQEILNQFSADFGYVETTFRVYPLSHLFYCLKNTVHGYSTWASSTVTINELQRDVYDYTTNISCELHEFQDATVNCSKSIVTRTAYVICDNCCKALDIALIPGRHVPVGSKVSIESNRSLSARASTYAMSCAESIALTAHDSERQSLVFEDPQSDDLYDTQSWAPEPGSGLRRPGRGGNSAVLLQPIVSINRGRGRGRNAENN